MDKLIPGKAKPVNTCDKWATKEQLSQEIIDRVAKTPQRQHYISQTSRDKYTIIRRNGIEYISSTLRTQPRLFTAEYNGKKVLVTIPED